MLSADRRGLLSTVLTVVLFIALVGAVSATVYIAINPPETSPPFTEYYLLGPDGNASGYPTELQPADSGVVVVGISNHEHEQVTYRSTVAWNGTVTQSTNRTLADGATHEQRVRITAPDEPGRYNVSFKLYVNGGEQPSEWTRLWVTVDRENATGK